MRLTLHAAVVWLQFELTRNGYHPHPQPDHPTEANIHQKLFDRFAFGSPLLGG